MRISVLVSAFALVLAGSHQAGAESPSFVADMVQSHPQHGTQQGRMFSSPEGVRVETQQQGRQVVQISLPKLGVMRMLFPQERTYMEHAVPAVTDMTQPETPCAGVGEAKCERVGSEKLGAVTADKYVITAPQRAQGQAPATLLVWWDPQRKMPLRQEFSDGGVMNVTFKGPATHEGRPVEQWESTAKSGKGETQTTQQLFDTELGLAVREDFGGGAVRELRNIKIVKPDPSWFAVPQGFTKVEPQQQPPQPMPQQPMPQRQMPQQQMPQQQPQGGYGQPPGGYYGQPGGYGR